MKRRITSLNTLLGISLLFLVVLSGCAKDELVAPAQAPVVTKSLTRTSNTDQPANGGVQPGARPTGGNDSISDDGDDVGDGERNKKKKPS